MSSIPKVLITQTQISTATTFPSLFFLIQGWNLKTQGGNPFEYHFKKVSTGQTVPVGPPTKICVRSTRMHARSPPPSSLPRSQSCSDLREEWRPLGVSSSLSAVYTCFYISHVDLRHRAPEERIRIDAGLR